MTVKEQLLQEIQNSPEQLLLEVLDFFLFTKNRHFLKPNPEIAEKQVNQKPIWEFAQELMQDAPSGALTDLPIDSARNHDQEGFTILFP